MSNYNDVLGFKITTIHYWEDDDVAMLAEYYNGEPFIVSVEMYQNGLKANVVTPREISKGCYCLKRNKLTLDWNDFLLMNKVIYGINNGDTGELVRKIYS